MSIELGRLVNSIQIPSSTYCRRELCPRGTSLWFAGFKRLPVAGRQELASEAAQGDSRIANAH